MDAAHYFRIQPTGQSIFGHQTVAIIDGAEAGPGEVFAFSEPHLLLASEVLASYCGGCWTVSHADELEVVEFAGDDERDPGDFEGVLVTPSQEVRRSSLASWLAWAAQEDDDLRDYVESNQVRYGKIGVDVESILGNDQ